MAEAVLIAVTKIASIVTDEAVKGIIAKLSEKVTNLKELPLKIEQIRKQLTIMSNVIAKIGTVYLTDEVVRSWIGEVRNVAYHVEDVMDKYSYHVLQLKEERFLKKYFVKGTHYAKVFSEITDEVVRVEKEIQLVIQMKGQWLLPSQLVANPLTEMERQQSKDNFPGLVKDEDLVGIEENRALLTEWLYSEELDNTVITVSGMGGLGKSTLDSNVYEREKINFSAHAWIVVSQVYTLDALLRKLLWKIGYTEQPLSAGISSPTHHLELLPLGNSDAFDLFCRRAFYNRKGHICPKDLEAIAISIVDRCHGLPLAIITIGSLLSSRQGLDFWKNMYNQLRSELSNNDHVRAILNLSYHDLSGDLRNCFLYCSLFPEDHPMSRDSLVRLWVAEGFVLGKDKNTPEMVAEGNLMELIHRNMLEVVENDELGRVTTCKMHDIVRELAISVAKEERFASANDYGTMIQMGKDVRRLSSCGWKDNTALKLNLPHLRTVVALGVISPSPSMLSSILAQSNYLTVLELEDSEVTEVPTSIGSLFNLRYIGLRRTRVKSLPDNIENLSHLHTLDIKQTKIEKLPRGLFKIKKLRHLLADRYADEKQTEFRYFIGVQAPKELSSLEELQTLETVESSNDLAEQLRKLMQLRSVWIDNISAADCGNLFATLSTMPLLSSLLLSARDENEALCFQALQPTSTDLHRLIIRGQWAKGTLNCPIFLSHGKNLKYLALSWCHLGEDPLGMLAPHMPNLTYLKLNNIRSANALVLAADSFPNLKTLVLKLMPDVKVININSGALPCIEGLFIVSLPKLDKVPQGIESLHSLKKLWLLSLHKDFRSKWLNNRMHQNMQHVPEVRV
ncbi:hypothetical protein ACQ4PT_049244 [Festuca glaucescens]